jgi:hypothetical protein
LMFDKGDYCVLRDVAHLHNHSANPIHIIFLTIHKVQTLQ